MTRGAHTGNFAHRSVCADPPGPCPGALHHLRAQLTPATATAATLWADGRGADPSPSTDAVQHPEAS